MVSRLRKRRRYPQADVEGIQRGDNANSLARLYVKTDVQFVQLSGVFTARLGNISTPVRAGGRVGRWSAKW